MKKIMFVALALVALAACEKQSESSAMTTNSEFVVEKLFNHQGCSVFRFRDNGRAHYYTRCTDSNNVQTISTENCGKNCVRDSVIRTE